MTIFLLAHDGLQTLQEDGGATIAILPGADIALHKVRLSSIQPQRRLSEARILATDLAAQPIEDLHVAIGPPDTDGLSWLAITNHERMQEYLGELRAQGAEPDHILPAALAIPPESWATLGPLTVVHEKEVAGTVAPALAPLVAGTSRQSTKSFAPDRLPDPLPLDLLQGSFAPRRQWWTEKRFRLHAGLLLAALLLLLVAPYGLQQLRISTMVRNLDQNVVELAEQRLPRETSYDSAEQAATMLAAARRAHESGAVGPRLSFIARELSAIPGARITLAERLPTGELRLVLGGSAAAIDAVRQRLGDGPFAVRASGSATTIGERKDRLALGQNRLEIARARLQQAQQDAAIIAANQTPRATAAAELLEMLTSAGLADARLEASGQIRVPAARTTVLLPLVLQMERTGTSFRKFSLRPNDDQTISAILVPRS